jgi:hypothetical protein
MSKKVEYLICGSKESGSSKKYQNAKDRIPILDVQYLVASAEAGEFLSIEGYTYIPGKLMQRVKREQVQPQTVVTTNNALINNNEQSSEKKRVSSTSTVPTSNSNAAPEIDEFHDLKLEEEEEEYEEDSLSKDSVRNYFGEISVDRAPPMYTQFTQTSRSNYPSQDDEEQFRVTRTSIETGTAFTNPKYQKESKEKHLLETSYSETERDRAYNESLRLRKERGLNSSDVQSDHLSRSTLAEESQIVHYEYNQDSKSLSNMSDNKKKVFLLSGDKHSLMDSKYLYARAQYSI